MEVSPGRTVTIGATDYKLDGSFGTLRAVQEAFKKDLYQLRADVMYFRVDQVAHLIAIGSGHPRATDEIGEQIIDHINVLEGGPSSDYITLKLELLAWLTIASSAKPDRQKKSAELQTMLDGRKTKSNSPGTNTSDSPSASSDGSPASSGEATSGN